MKEIPTLNLLELIEAGINFSTCIVTELSRTKVIKVNDLKIGDSVMIIYPDKKKYPNFFKMNKSYIFQCPLCQSKVVYSGKLFRCTNKSCSFVINEFSKKK